MNTFYLGDNLEVMRGFESACVDLCYTDPPFLTNKKWRGRAGSFEDRFDILDEEAFFLIEKSYPKLATIINASTDLHSEGMRNYLTFMVVRLIEIHRLLKPTGSMFLHIDPRTSHYLKLALDAIFGANNFKNEIIWHYEKQPTKANHFLRNHDVILYYAKSNESLFQTQYHTHLTPGAIQNRKAGYRTYRGQTAITIYDREHPRVKAKMDEWVEKGTKLYYITDIERGAAIEDVWYGSWNSSSSPNWRTGYPTQKPEILMERAIRATTVKDDIVLDPFAGSGATGVAAAQTNRNYILIDRNTESRDVVEWRMARDMGLFNDLRIVSDDTCNTQGVNQTQPLRSSDD